MSEVGEPPKREVGQVSNVKPFESAINTHQRDPLDDPCSQPTFESAKWRIELLLFGFGTIV